MTASQFFPAFTAVLLSLVAAAAPAVARLSVHPTSYNLQIGEGEILEVPLHITNLGPVSPLGFQVTDDRPWLSEDPTSGLIAMGDTVEVTVTVDATGLGPGDYLGTITVIDPHHGPILIPVSLTVQGTTGADWEWTRAPGGLMLARSSPNPMLDNVEIRFALPKGSLARLALFDARGREVALLLHGPVPPGEMRVQWNGLDRAGRPAPSGVYFYALDSGGERLVRRLLRVR